ncbi:S1 RNA-binding domain-containing protein [Pedobacter sp. SYP-B3415]|uniref:CvfB family protein n=1 Tax=Pedobacter sp. SYP-B3415 TaxID=2496641 RepID=UPI00101BA988|nr:S1-like domain-containing RNA-binding protein [Pedobacter sp. SYP-B3415]
MIQIGRYNTLKADRKAEPGWILEDLDSDENALLSFQEVPRGLRADDLIEVFIYADKEGRLLATTKRPFACVGDFAYLKVVSAEESGAFLDLGIAKDIYVPKKEQKRPMKAGEWHVVYVYLDEVDERLLASSRLTNHIEKGKYNFEEGDEVELLITERTDLGYNAIIDNHYPGLLYHNEVFTDLNPGERHKGWVKKIRATHEIDLTLQPSGFGHILNTRASLLEALKNNGGYLKLGDKSTPEEIYQQLRISKNVFKKAIGGLYKERLIELGDNEIRLIAAE